MSLFEQLGGAVGVRQFVDELSRRSVDDPLLRPLFNGVDEPALRQHREQYFAAVLGGPENYAGRGLREAHQSLQLRDIHIDRFTAIVHESLVAVGANEAATADIRAMITRLRPVIVSVSPGSAR